MKRWFLFAAFTAALPVIALACGDDNNGGGVTVTPDSGKPTPTTTTTATTTNTSPTGTTTTQPPVDAGPDGAKRTGCLDRPTSIQRPDKLPCELIPPGLTL